ncbi:hypothetical protein [Flexithrix dorotheae]|uniref:hypothetical protein n=1 Tax=Flexithrix dorotheae TaxID=70993 RepID=UPI00035D7E4E|nr:hypothetical protein [Flexithrix dorotheae]
MKIIWKLNFLTCCLIFIGNLGLAQTVSETFKQTFAYQQGEQIDIRNIYGKIKINHWEKDSVSVVVNATVKGKDKEAAEKNYSRVKIELKKDGKIISGITEMEGSMVKNLITSGDDFDIDYELFLPTTSDLSVTLRKGKFETEKLSCKAKLNLTDSELTIEEITENVSFDLNNATVKIEKLGYAFFALSSSTVTVDKADKIDINSTNSSSTVELGEVLELYLDSKNDKIGVRKLNKISGTFSFSKVNILDLSEQADLNMTNGSFLAENIQKEFTNIKLVGKSTDIDLSFAKGASLQADIKGKSEKLTIPESGYLSVGYADKKKKMMKITGYLGENEAAQAKLDITEPSGSVTIKLKER